MDVGDQEGGVLEDSVLGEGRYGAVALALSPVADRAVGVVERGTVRGQDYLFLGRGRPCTEERQEGGENALNNKSQSSPDSNLQERPRPVPDRIRLLGGRHRGLAGGLAFGADRDHHQLRGSLGHVEGLHGNVCGLNEDLA